MQLLFDPQIIPKSKSLWLYGKKKVKLMLYLLGPNLVIQKKYIHFFNNNQFLKTQTTFLDENSIWRLAQQLLQPVVYLHSNQIIHRDLKPANILIDQNHQLIVSDFGSAIFNNYINANQFGTPLYQAPEILKNQKWDQKVDIWSLGCILYYIIKLKPPFDGITLKQLQYNIIFKQAQPLNCSLSSQLRDFISKMLEKNPQKRISAKEALQIVKQNIQNEINEDIIRVNVLSKFQFKYFQGRLKNEEINKSQSTLQLNNSSVRAVDGDLEMSDSDIFPRSPRQQPLESQISIEKPFINSIQKIEKIDKQEKQKICTPASKDERLDLFSTIKKIRPNSAVAVTGKEYIRENLRNDKKENVVQNNDKKQIFQIREQIQQEQSLEMLKFRQAKQANSRKEYIRIHNIPKQFSQQTSRIVRPQTALPISDENQNAEIDKRTLYAQQGKKWTMRIQSATFFRK